jgi:hypothetical protein
MSTEVQVIPFNEEGLRNFKDVRDAIKYYTETLGLNVAMTQIERLHSYTFQINTANVSVNVSSMDPRDPSLRVVFESDEHYEVFLKNITDWENKFVTDVHQTTSKKAVSKAK